jgi:alpha-galactosidase
MRATQSAPVELERQKDGMFMMKARALSIAFAACLCVCLPACASDLVGTWIAPNPNPYLHPGQHRVGYPNSNAFTERFVFAREQGILTGIHVTLTGKEPVGNLKVEGQTISFSQGSNFYSGEIRGNELQLFVGKGKASKAEPYTCRRATAEDLKIIEEEPSYEFAKVPLPPLHDVPSNGVARTPPMGLGNFVETNDAEVRKVADDMVSSGLRDAGYVYLQIDEGWQGHRDAQGNIHPNAGFPDMKALIDYVHSKGLKFGIYSSPGPAACWGYAGSYGHEDQDAKAYADWGVDYLKYDWCSAGKLYQTQAEMQALYQRMGEALQATGRPVVYSLCQYGLFDVTSWGHKAGANLWRTTGDIGDRWESMSRNGFDGNGKLDNIDTGGWNDPDDLQIGIGGMTTEEYRTQMTLWTIMAAPLIVEMNNNDIAKWTPAIKEILLNKEVIAVDQDPLGRQGHRVFKHGLIEYWSKPMSNGTTVIALFNRGNAESKVNVRWADLQLKNVLSVRDLWRQTDLGNLAQGYVGTIPAHGVVFLKVTAEQ